MKLGNSGDKLIKYHVPASFNQAVMKPTYSVLSNDKRFRYVWL